MTDETLAFSGRSTWANRIESPLTARVPEPRRALPRVMSISLPSTVRASEMSLSGVPRPCSATSPLFSSKPPS